MFSNDCSLLSPALHQKDTQVIEKVFKLIKTIEEKIKLYEQQLIDTIKKQDGVKDFMKVTPAAALSLQSTLDLFVAHQKLVEEVI